jgi:hypothetical protein
MKHSYQFFAAVVISFMAATVAAQITTPDPSRSAQPERSTVAQSSVESSSASASVRTDQPVREPQTSAPAQPTSSGVPTPQSLPPIAQPNNQPAAVSSISPPSCPAEARSDGGAETDSPSASSFPGVSTSKFVRAGVATEAFVRPGVSTAQLATLLPGNRADVCGGAPRDFVLYPEPTRQPRRIPANGDER